MKIEPPALSNLKTELKTSAEKIQSPSSVQEILQGITNKGEKNFQALVLADSTVIEGSNAAEAKLFKVLIKIASLELFASSPLPLKKGQQLDIELVADKGLMIRHIRNTADNIQQQALRLLTPQQEELAPLLALLQQYKPASNDGNTVVSSLEQQLENAVQTLLSKLPTLEQLKAPGQMKQALLHSGLFHELKLKEISQNPTAQTRNLRPQPPGKTNADTEHPINLDLKSLLKRFQADLNQLKTAEKTSNEQAEQESTQQKNLQNTDQNNKTKTAASTATLEKTLKTAANPVPESLAASNNKSNAPVLPTPLSTFLAKSPVYGPLPVKITNNVLESAQGKIQPDPKEKKENLDNVIENLLRQSSGVLAKIQLNQLASLDQSRPASSNDSQSLQQWFFELPLNTGARMDNVFIHIQQKEAGKSGKENAQEKSWQLDLGFDLGEFGKVHIEVFLVKHSARSILWAESNPTYQKINEQLAQLKTNLEQLGVNVERLECRQGKVPERKSTRITTRLIDVTS